MTPYEFLLIGLATYAFAWALVYGKIFERLRENRFVLRWTFGLLDCTHCTAFWVALLFYWIWFNMSHVPIEILAIMGLEVLITRIRDIGITWYAGNG